MRITNRIASAVLGLVLVVGGLLIAVEAIRLNATDSAYVLPLDRWYASLRSVALDDGRLLGASIAVAAVGLALVLVQVRPWPPDRVRLTVTPTAPWWASRRSIERRIGAAVGQVSGVSQVESKVRGRAQNWHLRMRAEASSDRRDAVFGAAQDELRRLDAPDDTDIRVSLRPSRRRVT